MTERDDRMNHAFDLFKTPFYAWIGAGVRTAEILGDIGARVRAEEEARDRGETADAADAAAADAGATDAGDSADGADAGARSMTDGIADSVSGRIRDARRRVRDLGDNAADQGRDAFLNALDAAQKAFNDALTRAQAGGDRAFASAQSLPDDVQAAADQLRPEHMRAVADGYLEAASKIYRELAARGEQAVDEGMSVARERGAASEGEDGEAHGFFGKLPFGGAPASRLAESLEGLARDTVKPFQEAGTDFLGRLDQEKLSARVEVMMKQAADITEQLLGALRAEDAGAAQDRPAQAGDIVDGEVVDDDVPAEAAEAAKAAEAEAKKDAGDGTDNIKGDDIKGADVSGAADAGAAEDNKADDHKADGGDNSGDQSGEGHEGN